MMRKFEKHIQDTKDEFILAVNKLQWDTKFREKCENLIIVYDTMRQMLLKNK